ncbi:MAG: hypothetical protein IT307_08520 [Chloroflexi bacterium]|nr:hypothetical protein [Chloroflexota bacterium]
MEGALKTLLDASSGMLYMLGLMALVASISTLLTRLVTRKSTLKWVWNNWNPLGAALLVLGLAAIVYGWVGLGLQTGNGSSLVGLGLLLSATGLWMVSL